MLMKVPKLALLQTGRSDGMSREILPCCQFSLAQAFTPSLLHTSHHRPHPPCVDGESGWVARTEPASKRRPHPARPGGESGWLAAAYCRAQSATFFTRVTSTRRGDGFLFPLLAIQPASPSAQGRWGRQLCCVTSSVSYSTCFTIGTRPKGSVTCVQHSSVSCFSIGTRPKGSETRVQQRGIYAWERGVS